MSYKLAALADHAYHRAGTGSGDANKDQALTLADIDPNYTSLKLTDTVPGPTTTTIQARALELGLQMSTDGFFYNGATGFVGTIVKHGVDFIIAYRGTDAGNATFDDVKNAITTGSGDPKHIDNEDMLNNRAVGGGSLSDVGQHQDAMKLAELALQLSGDQPDKITVTGQSLGGGLAGFVGAVHGFDTYIVAPAPFKKQLEATSHYLTASKETLEAQSADTTGYDSLADYFKPEFWDVTTEHRVYMLDNGAYPAQNGLPVTLESFIVDEIYNINSIPTLNAVLNELRTKFDTIQSDKLATYTKRVDNDPEDITLPKFEIHTIDGEILSSGAALWIAEVFADHFDTAHEKYDIGNGNGWNLGTNFGSSYVGFHSPSLHALVIRTEDTGKEFSALLRSDAQLRHIFTENGASAGPIAHDRSDLVTTTSSGMELGYFDTTIMYRALWKTVNNDALFWNYFFTVYSQVAAGGAAADGIQANTNAYAPSTGPSIHSGVLQLSLSIFRDGLQNTQTLTEVKQNIGGNLGLGGPSFAFAGSNDDGVTPRNDRVILDITAIKADLSDQDGVNHYRAQSDRVLGVRDIDYEIVSSAGNSLFNDGSISVPYVGDSINTAIYLGVDYQQLLLANDALKPWEVLVVQGGSGTGSFLHNALFDDDGRLADKSHVIIGGSSTNVLTGSNKDDYLIGGDGGNFFFTTKGEDLIVGGAANDELNVTADRDLASSATFIGGGGEDIANYFEAGSPVTVKYIQEQVGSQTVDAFDVRTSGDTTPDILFGVEKIIGTASGSDALDFTNYDGQVYFGSNGNAFENQLYTGYDYTVESVHTAVGISLGEVVKQGKGFQDGQVVFHGFEHIIGSGSNDRISIARNDGSGPITIDGGVGDDGLRVGKVDAIINGGTGTDIIMTSGNTALVSGGADPDLFKLGPNAFVLDADDTDVIEFGAFTLTGGVQFGWQESPYAYWQPFSAILMGVPTVAAHFAEFWTLFAIDIAFMSWMRYYQTDSGQLVAEMARGLGGKIVIENYDLNIETGRATGGITVFSVDYTEFNSASVGEFNKFVDLALQQGFGVRLGGYDPLVIDLDKDGLDLTRRNQRDVYFDLDADGFAESTGWVREDDGLLAVDLNSDGEINDITELFGDETTAGLTALAAYDSNQDGVINSQDAQFSDLLIWQDLNQNGKTDAGELSDLATHGIVEISLTGRAPDQAVVGGNEIREIADVTFADGTTSIAGDVWFSADQTDSQYLGDTTTSAAADALPSIRGFGDMASLRVAMTSDAALLTLVTDFTTLPATTDWQGYQSAATGVLFQWAGVSAVAATPLGSGGFDLQKLAFLEKAAGLQLAPRDETTGDVLDTNVTELEMLWQEALSSNTARLLFQSGYQGYLSGITYDETTDVFTAASDNPTALSDTFTNLFAALPADPVLAEQMWDQNLAPAIAAAIGIMTRHDGITVRTDFVIGQLVRSHDGAVHNLTVDQLVDGLGYDNVQVSGPFLRGEAEGLQVYAGTTGDDTFTGGNGQDVYVFDDVIGHDVIFDAEPGSTAGGDRLRLVHLEEADVSFTRVGVDLVVTVIATGETITVKNQYTAPSYAQSGRQTSSNWGIEDVQFADGTIFELSDIGAAIGQGTELGETITGTGFDDQLTGGGGNDILEGGDGGDLYVFGAGDGEDIIRDEMVNPFNDRQDLLVFTGGISLDDLRFERTLDSDDLKITFDNPLALTDSITIIGQFAYSFYGYDSEYSLDQRVDAFATDRDAPINWIDLQQRVIESYTTDGDDITYGFGTTDIFEASGGNDWISGGDGGDLYQFGYGSDHDTIEDNQVYQDIGFNILPGGGNFGTDDYLWFGPGISVEDVTFSAIAGTRDLLISIDDDPNVAGASDTLRIVDQFNGKRVDLFNLVGISWFDRIENFTFEDGTTLTWEDVLDIVTTGDDQDNDLIGDHRADTLTGNGGDDHLSGGDDGDTYVYNLGDGNDTIEDNQYDFFTSAADKLQFGAGITSSDVSFDYGPTEKDVVITLTDGSTITLINQLNGLNNYIFGVNWFDRIETLEFTDAQGQVVDTIGWDAIMTSLVSRQQTAGDDTIYGIDSHFGAWSDTIDAGAGNDTIFARGGHDTITGGTGNDTIDGGWGNDTYIFNPGDGIDTVQDTGSGIDTADTLIIGYNVADVSVARIAGTNDIVLTFAGSSDQITVINALSGKAFKAIDVYQFLDGTWTPTSIAQGLVDSQVTEGADVIFGSGTLNGLGGNDLIWGEGAADTLSGGTGDDFLDGGAGDDIYLYSAGDGHDTIHDQGNGLDNDDILKITGYTSAQTSVVLFNGLDQIDLVFAGSNDRISIIDPLSSGAFSRGINHIEFVDEGITWGQAEISALAIAAQATAGDDVIVGSDTGDIIDGSTGHDDISGGKGLDDITGGAGNDRIDGGVENDTYRFGQGDGQDTIADTGNGLDNADRLIISDYLSSETIVQRIAGTENVLLTFAGSTDSITLIRPLTGSYLNQIETYEFEADGTIWTPADLAAQILVPEITAGDDDMQGFDTDDTIFAGPGNDSIHGHGGDDILSGDVGDDFIDGGSGDDTYLYTIGDGHDTIHDQGNGLDTDDILKITGYSTAQTTVEIVNGTNQIDLVFTLDGDRISLINPLETGSSARGINLIEFVDEGITWGSADISALVMAAQSTSGDDQIIGSGIADIITGGLGDDHIEGGNGNDTYIFSLGDGNDTIEDNGNGLSSSDQLIIHGYATGDVSAAWVGSTDNIELSFAGTSDTIILVDGLNQSVSNTIEEFVFDDATVWHKTVSGDAGFVSELSALVTASQVTAGNDVIRGSQLRDDIDGGAGNDTIDGDGGNDTLAGGLGDDYVDGGKGDDTYIFNLGDGHDTIIDNGNGLDDNDRLIINGYLIEDVTVTQVTGTDDVEITFAGSSDKITLIDPLASGVSKTIEYYEFVSGGTTTVWTKQDLIDAVLGTAPPPGAGVTHPGTAGVDSISGTSGDDVIQGFGGDDTLTGNAGADTYLYTSGDGNDTINDSVYVAGDVLKLTDLNATDVQLTKSGNHMLITDLITGHVITDNYHFLSATNLNRGIDTIQFADGSSWDYATINANAWIRGTSGNDSLSGSSSFDETLQGYAGDDTLTGNGGADTYVYASGDGNDTINDSVYVAGDILKLTDLNATDIQLSKSGNHLLITDLITGHVITDNYHFLSATNLNRGIDTIEFADGSSWDYATINANAWIRGTSGNDSLSGSSSFDETLQGYAGDDTLTGNGGADTYVYASGDGNDTINDSVYVAGDVLKLTDLNAADIELSKSGFHLLITDTTTSEVITDNYHFLSTTNLNRGIDAIEFADGSSWDYETINAVARIGTTMQADTASGTTGDDVIIGLAGNDTLTGLAGADTFVFAAGDGSDTITDFSIADADLIDVSAYGFASNTGFTSFSFDGSDTLIDFNGTDQLTVAGVDLTTQPIPDDVFIFT